MQSRDAARLGRDLTGVGAEHGGSSDGSIPAFSPAPGVLVAAGQRGSIYRSADDGKTWLRVDSRAKVSITTLIAHGRELLAMGLDGLQLRSTDQGQSFSGSHRRDRAPLTAAAVRSDGLVRFSP